ncbi:hypothetical protein [Homoserinimonas sp. OAct 916]|uniref:hypothetical protein n=1 Tax=Homoserinimonas sp. OAct 916 TaxID=2211450 RepID=UPI001E653D68|nr:hypothetical protein [Homoserinimonas sp. OAct 916]
MLSASEVSRQATGRQRRCLQRFIALDGRGGGGAIAVSTVQEVTQSAKALKRVPSGEYKSEQPRVPGEFMTEYFVTRVPRPEWLDSHNDNSGLERALGGQPEWFWSIPGVFRALASPRTGEAVPVLPREIRDVRDSLSYWTSLQYLLLYRLGWTRPDRGLRWWYDEEKPVDDPTLKLISKVWDRDGQLDHYLGWLLEGRPRFDISNAVSWADVMDEGEKLREPLSDEWEQWKRSHGAREREEHPFAGGTDPFHLTGHTGQTIWADSSATIAVVSLEERRAVLLADNMAGWYLELGKLGAGLPDIGASSWYVDVFVKTVGYLGTYRKSRETGLWFSGRHRLHVAGNDGKFSAGNH